MSVEMEGMKMPGMTQTVCNKKGAREEDKVPMDKNCKVLESKKSGSKHTFKFQCTEGKDTYTGTGEMESLSKDAWRSKMTASGTREGEKFAMTTDMSGKRVGGCTWEDPAKKVKEIQAQSDAMIAKACDDQIAALEPAAFIDVEGMPAEAQFCKSRKADFCAQTGKVLAGMRDPKGYADANSKYRSWRLAAKGCGTDPASISGPVCKTAIDKKDTQFVSNNCPAEAAEYRKQHCAGRDYTTVDTARREMCSALGGLSYTSSTPAKAKSPVDNATDKIKEGTDKLKKFLKW